MTRHMCIFLLAASPWISIQGMAGVQDTARGLEVTGNDTIYFGKYPAREQKTASFKIRNAGSDTINIIKVHKTCGCATASCNKPALKPGEEATVDIVILPNSIFGAYCKPTYIENSSVNNKFLPVTVKGFAVPLLEIKPQDFIYAGRMETNRPSSYSFDITATEQGVKLGEPEVKCNYPVETAMKQVGDARLIHYSFDVKILPSATSGDFQCSIKVPLISPSNNVPLVLGISGKIGTEMVAFPGTFRLSVSENDIIRKFNLRVLGDKSIMLDPKKVTLPEDKRVRWELKQADDGRTINVMARFTPEFTREVYVQGKVEMYLSVPGIASAKILCLAETPAMRK